MFPIEYWIHGWKTSRLSIGFEISNFKIVQIWFFFLWLLIVFITFVNLHFKFFTGHWQKPVCGRISDGWGKRRKWKLKNCFHFPPPPYSSCFPFFDRELVWPRSSISIMLKIILRTTHTIFDELLNRSQNKKLLAIISYLEWLSNWEREKKAWFVLYESLFIDAGKIVCTKISEELFVSFSFLFG